MIISREDCRSELRSAVRQLRERGLNTAAKWAAQQLVGLEDEPTLETPPGFTPVYPAHAHMRRQSLGGKGWQSRGRLSDVTATPSASKVSFGNIHGGVSQPVDFEHEDDRYMLGKAFFDAGEYRRAAFALKCSTGKKAFFLMCYSLYLAGEKRKEEEVIELAGPLGKTDTVNGELVGLEQQLSKSYKDGNLDAFGMYLYGVVLHDRGCEAAARNILVESVNDYPWNWSAWLKLQALCTNIDILNGLKLKDHWMRDFFLASAYLELQRNTEGLAKYEQLREEFVYSDYVSAQIATAHYNLRDFDEAEGIFEELLLADPYRIDAMDVYSNILYVKECFAALSHLAHKVFLTDKYRPESCCIIGNYYSLKSQHEKAIIYFKRALKLNKEYLSAWTLMGHEYVELKNTPAAIDAYRRAVDINPRDFRAWYGLGQTYELMGMPSYAIHYYRQSTCLRPHDARMWIAIGQCYEKEQLQMYELAIKCYNQAVENHDSEGIAVYKLANLHKQLGNLDQAAHYFKINLDRMDREQQSDSTELTEALHFLANYHKRKNNLDMAELFATRLLDYSGPAKEDAKILLRGIKSEQDLLLFPSMDVDTNQNSP